MALHGLRSGRGLDNDALLERFQIGFADRTLGLRLPDKNRQAGAKLRARLTQLGLWWESGHEHFNGCIVVPFHNPAGSIVSLYGRRAQGGDLKHLYPPGPHRGLFNLQCFNQSEIILCEAVFDALTFYANGFENVTSLFGTEGFTDELWQALRKVRRVRIAYDADDARERAAQRDAQRFREQGIEVYRIKFPWGMDANAYAQKVSADGNPSADKSLALLLNSAAWLGGGKAEPEPTTVAAVLPEPADSEAQAQQNGVLASSHSLAACVSSLEGQAAKEKKPPTLNPVLERNGEAWFLELEDREYRVAGLEKTLGTESLKVTLRLRLLPGPSGSDQGSALFHLDQIDLTRDSERRRFIERAAEETGLTLELLKRDMGKLLLAVEQAQIQCLAAEQTAEKTPVMLTPEEREEALAWLRAPKLIDRLREAFHKTGIMKSI